MATLLDDLNLQLPPFKVYFLSRQHPRGPLPSQRVIARRSGIPYRTVQRLCSSVAWERIDATACAFLAACGFVRVKGNIFVMRRHNASFRHNLDQAVIPMPHLNKKQFRRFSVLSNKWAIEKKV